MNNIIHDSTTIKASRVLHIQLILGYPQRPISNLQKVQGQGKEEKEF